MAVREWAIVNGNSSLRSRQMTEKLQISLIELQEDDRSEEKQGQCAKLWEELQEYQLHEMLDAKQKAHMDWIMQGDQSTSFVKGTKTHHAKRSVMRMIYANGIQVTSLRDKR